MPQNKERIRKDITIASSWNTFMKTGSLFTRSFITNNAWIFLLLICLAFSSFRIQAQPDGKSKEMTAFIKKQAIVMARQADDWAKDNAGDILSKGMQEFLNKNNIDKKTMGKILSSMAGNRKTIQEIYEGASTSDIQGAALSTQLLLGKIIAENVPESKMAAFLNELTKYPKEAAEVSSAIGSFAGGDYYRASESIGKIIWNQTQIGKSIDMVIKVEKAGWDFLIQNQYDAAYQKYKENGSEGLVRLFSGPAAYVRNKYFQGKSVGDEVIARKMAELFEARKNEEQAVQTEQVKLERMYSMFQRMDKSGGTTGVIADLRTHWEKYGNIKNEPEVFDRFLWLTRSIRRDLLSVGIDLWLFNKTLNSQNPEFSAEALSLLVAFAQGGQQAYKEKFRAIAITRFPKAKSKGPENYTGTMTGGWKREVIKSEWVSARTVVVKFTKITMTIPGDNGWSMQGEIIGVEESFWVADEYTTQRTTSIPLKFSIFCNWVKGGSKNAFSGNALSGDGIELAIEGTISEGTLTGTWKEKKGKGSGVFKATR